VYRATDATHGREVAIKVLPGTLGEAERRRFDRERQTMGRLGAHPYIIPVYDSGYTDDGEGYIVMEFASGGSLRDRLKSGPLPWDEAARVMAAVAEASQAAHDNGVLHRDIKPDNILIDQFGNPKLSDFGIAAVASNATATTSTTATLAHAAPELLQGRPSTEAVDIYAVGSTFHALLTGLPPFFRPEDDGVAPMITRALTEPPPDLRRYNVPDPVARVIEQALAKEPAARQATASQLSSDLRNAAAGQAPPGAAAGATNVVPSAFTGGPVVSGPPPTPPPEFGPTGHHNPSAPTTGGIAASTPHGFHGAPSQPTTPTPQPHGYVSGDPNATSVDHSQGTEAGPYTPTPGMHTGSQPGVGYPTTPSWDPPQASPPPADGKKARIGLIALAAAILLAGVGVITLVLVTGDDTGTEAGAGGQPGSDESTSTSTTEPSSTTTASTTTTSSPTTTSTAIAADQPTVQVDCPTEIALGVKIFCSIVTTNAVSGEWHLPAFLAAPEPLEVVPGDYEIFIEPTNADAVGRTFTITATAEGADGTTARASHSFTVVGVLVEINCPDRINLNSQTVCDIITTNATEGEWDIPGFGGADLEVVPGSNPIFIEPLDPGSIGQRFTITATARDASGQSHSASSEFIVTPADG